MPTELISALTGPNPGPVVAVLICGFAAAFLIVVPVTHVLSDSWRRVQEMREEVDLKRELLARGLSVDEIVRIMQSTRDPAAITAQSKAAQREHWQQWAAGLVPGLKGSWSSDKTGARKA